MVARSKKDIEKAHALNKRVRREKARLRRRRPKKHSRYDRMVMLHLELEPEVKELVRAEAKRRGVSEERVIRETLTLAVAMDMEKLKEKENGIQEESNIEVDKNTK